MGATDLNAKNPLVYNPITLGIPVASKLFGKKGDKNNVAGKHAAYDAAPLGAYTGGDPLESTSGEPLPDSAMGPGSYEAFSAYKSFFGRNPTAIELAQANPYAITGDKNFGNQNAVNSFVSDLAMQAQNTPEAIAKRTREKQLAEAPKHFDAIKGLFQSTIGRDATTDELNHFGSLLASGTTDAYDLQKFLEQQPEYTQKQDKAFQEGLSGQLAGYDKQYFGEKILPSIQENFAKQGRSFDSSAFQNSATQSAQQQNVERQKYIAGLSASQYGGRQDRAYNDYAAQVANQQNQANFNLNAQFQTGQQNLARSQNLADYQMQQNSYNQYLAKYGKRNNGAQGAIGGATSGAIAGGSMGGPWGALAGGVVGGLGGYFGSRGGSY